jgi:predicted phosphodiesterase
MFFCSLAQGVDIVVGGHSHAKHHCARQNTIFFFETS